MLKLSDLVTLVIRLPMEAVVEEATVVVVEVATEVAAAAMEVVVVDTEAVVVVATEAVDMEVESTVKVNLIEMLCFYKACRMFFVIIVFIFDENIIKYM